jgi:hypothetical protein
VGAFKNARFCVSTLFRGINRESSSRLFKEWAQRMTTAFSAAIHVSLCPQNREGL